MEIDLQALFAEMKGFMLTFASAGIKFDAQLISNEIIIMRQVFSATANESERTSESGIFSTVADSLDDVAAIAIRKSILDMEQNIQSAILNLEVSSN